MLSKTRVKQIDHKGFTITVAISYSKPKCMSGIGLYKIDAVILDPDGTSVKELEASRTIPDEHVNTERISLEATDLFNEIIANIDKPDLNPIEQFLVDNGFE